MTKTKSKLISCVIILAMMISMIGVLSFQQTAVASEQSALAAYREFLNSTHKFSPSDSGDQHIVWSLDNVRYAQLVDFDNDGIPELVLVVNFSPSLPLGHPDFHLHYSDEFFMFSNPIMFVVAYVEQAEIIQVVTLRGSLGAHSRIAIAYSSGGNAYFVRGFAETGGVIAPTERDFLALRHGEWVSVLNLRGFDIMADTIYEEWLEHYFHFINNNQVAEAEYIDAPAELLGIYRTTVFYQDMTNNVQAFLAMLDNRLAAPTVGVTVDGRPVSFVDQPPVIIDGRTLVPVRGVFEALGFEVDWESSTQRATLTREGDTVVITVGSAAFTTNGVTHTLDVPAQIINGRTMLPFRAVVESVGYSVGWDAASQTVVIGVGSF
ncbi:MAG: copper amine oxidase N-terminal domain-containing protein [Oscillospiraceae bacterium]|nr:copper amine oxidase N-terminal domain-containing protein [Oscillospiraceae bacterium]